MCSSTVSPQNIHSLWAKTLRALHARITQKVRFLCASIVVNEIGGAAWQFTSSIFATMRGNLGPMRSVSAAGRKKFAEAGIDSGLNLPLRTAAR